MNRRVVAFDDLLSTVIAEALSQRSGGDEVGEHDRSERAVHPSGLRRANEFLHLTIGVCAALAPY
jgi:hypothetical protein